MKNIFKITDKTNSKNDEFATTSMYSQIFIFYIFYLIIAKIMYKFIRGALYPENIVTLFNAPGGRDSRNHIKYMLENNTNPSF